MSLVTSLAPRASAQQLISDLVVQRTEAFTGDLTPATITADQNNYNPTSLATASALRLATDASRTLTGLAGGSDGRKLRLYNVGSFDLVLSNEHASSTAANRFALGASVTLAPNRGVELQYDAVSARWRAVGSPAQTAGTGTVTDFSAGDLAPLFTTSEATTTTTPALTFALTNASANTVLSGPASGVPGAPAYRALVAADLPNLSDTYQLLDADLTYLAGFTPSANVKSILNAADYTTIRSLLTLTIGTDVQAQNANLAGLAGLTSAADRLAYFSGIGGATALAPFTTYARTLLDDVDAGTARATLGLGTMAVAETTSYSTTAVINGWFNNPTTNGSFTAGNWRAGLGLPGFASADPGLTDLFPFWNDTTNLVNWQSAGATRTALALGPAALMSVGTTAGTLAAGDDSRITGAAQKAQNLADLQSASVARTNLGLGTMAVQNANAVAITGGNISGIAWQFANTGLKIEDTDSSHVLRLVPGSNLLADRSLTLITGDASRTLTLTGDTTLTGTNTGDQTTITGNAGTATTLQTPRAIYGNNFDGSGALTQVIASTYGGTGNGFTKFTGPTLTEKIFTLPDASSTLLYAGGAISGTTGTFSSYGSFAGTAAPASGASVEIKHDGTTGEVLSYNRTGAAYTNLNLRGLQVIVQANGTSVATFTSTGLNNTVIGATTPAAGSFTTVSATSSVKVYSGVGSGLPSAASAGQLAFVTDATSAQGTNSGATLVTGGANYRPVYSDGTNWKYF